MPTKKPNLKRKNKVLVKAWAIIDNDKLSVYDYRLPILWTRRQADLECREQTFTGKVVRATVEYEV